MTIRLSVLSVALGGASLCGLIGCSTVGVATLRNSRTAYNNAVIETNNEQILATIVRIRYHESTSMLAVSSITANASLQGTIGAQFGVGPDSSFSGNLVPLSAGGVYEENPTISYVPVQGQEYLRSMLSPMPLDLTVLILNSLGRSPGMYRLVIAEFNGVRCSELDGATPEEVERFAKATQVLAKLQRQGSLVWTSDDSPSSHGAKGGDAAVVPGYAMGFRGHGAEFESDMAALKELVGIDPEPVTKEFSRVRVALGLGHESGHTVAIFTRSLFDLLNVASAAVDVPESHLSAGLAPPSPDGLEFPLRIRSSVSAPARPLVSFQHYGTWFYIDAADLQSKQTFRVLEAITSARIADSSKGVGTPVLTVPISR
jgi:hypothetical protein